MLTERGVAQQARGFAESVNNLREAGAVAEAINKAQGIASLLSSTNNMMQGAVERLHGPFPMVGNASQCAAETAYPGQLGELMDVLDRVFNLASSNSDIAGQFNRI